MIIEQKKLRKIDDEEWKEVVGSNGRYLLSNYGRVKSFVLNKKDGVLLKCTPINGFKATQFTINKVNHRYFVHKLVAEYWIERPSENHIYVTHLDRNLKNNHVSNLAWLDRETLLKQYREYFTKLFNDPKRRKVMTSSKLKESDIKVLKGMLERGVPQVKIAKMFCISEMQVTRIKRGENWGHVTV